MAHFIWAVPDNNNIYNFPDRKIPVKKKNQYPPRKLFLRGVIPGGIWGLQKQQTILIRKKITTSASSL